MQTQFFKKQELAYGGSLQTRRKGRSGERPIVTRQTMHLVLRSSLAKGKWSFLEPKNKVMIREILRQFSTKYGVKLLRGANVGNHIHLEIQLSRRHLFKPFIRAVTGAIAMKVAGVSRWKTKKQLGFKKFWDRRPFTRVIVGWNSRKHLKNYIEINRLEGRGLPRTHAVQLVRLNSSA